MAERGQGAILADVCTDPPLNLERVAKRSLRPEVRNPVMAIPGVREAIDQLSPECRAALRTVLIAKDSAIRAQVCWKKHKAPMAAYWKAVSVYANHIQRLLRPAAVARG